MADAPKYPIGTIAEMAAIPEDARGRFLDELPEILSTVARAVEVHALVNEALGEDALSLTTPYWVDDDKGEATYSLTESDSGERIFSATMKMSGKSA